MDDFASMDTGILDAEFTDVAAPDATGDSTDLATQGGADGADAAPETALVTTTGDQRLTSDDGKLSPATLTALASLKATNPAIAQQLTRAAYSVHAFRQEFPGGLKEARELKARIADLESIGPIEATRQELAGFREYDRQFMTGDPKFVETLISTEPNAFQKLAPMIFQKFSELNPEGYGTLVAKASYGSMSDAGVPLNISMTSAMMTQLAARLPQELAPVFDQMVESFNQVVAWANQTAEKGRKQIAPPVAAPTPDPKADTERIGLLRSVWSQDTGRSLAQMYIAEFTKLAMGRRFTSEQKQNFQELFSMRLQKALQATEGFETRVDQYLKANDKEGHSRYLNSLYKAQVPRILATLIKPTAAPEKPAAPATPNQPAAAPAASGFTRLAAMPNGSDINFDLTNPNMIAKDQAILKDGRKVTW